MILHESRFGKAKKFKNERVAGSTYEKRSTYIAGGEMPRVSKDSINLRKKRLDDSRGIKTRMDPYKSGRAGQAIVMGDKSTKLQRRQLQRCRYVQMVLSIAEARQQHPSKTLQRRHI